jgi:cytosine/adenosine deaminase-related metal-dependent hydrolase
MILNNLTMALTGNPINIRVTNDLIAEVSASPFEPSRGQASLSFGNAIVFPGLINSHDHLDFNLFPQLGDRNYRNYTEWGRYIHKNYTDQISKILQVPLELREQWGIYKNLLNGVTTVVNHGKKIKTTNTSITVYEGCQSIHSVRFEKKWWLSLNNPFKRSIPVAIHTGEGTDESSELEVSQLIRRNMLGRSLIGVHGVAMNEQQAKAFEALVWCPESNYFLLGQTAPINCLKKNVPIVFGTDSTLTGDWNLWRHIRRARETHYLSDEELFKTLTLNAAKVWKLKCGELSPYKYADIVIAKNNTATHKPCAFFYINPEDILLVIHKGHISLYDEELHDQLKNIDPKYYSKVCLGDKCKYVKGNLPGLMQSIRQYYPAADFPVM